MGTNASWLRRVAACGAALLTGCNLLTGASDLEIDEKGVPPTALGDAQADGLVDPRADGGRGDATPADADGGAPGPRCSPLAIFCDDFDGTEGLTKWGSTRIGGGTSAIDSVASVSAPSSLLMRWPVTPTNGTVGVMLQASTKVAPKMIDVSLSVRLESADDDGKDGVSVVQILLGQSYALRVTVLRNGNLRLEEAISLDGGSSSTGSSLSRHLKEGNAFQTLRIALVLDTVPAVIAYVDGEQAGTKALAPQATGIFSLVLGDANVTGTTREVRIRYDNVVVVAQ